MAIFRPVSCGLAVLSLLLSGCGGKEVPDDPVKAVRLPRMETVRPTRMTLPIRIELTATIEPLEKADLCARVPGMVETLQVDKSKPEVDIGHQVEAGEPLVKLAVPDLEADRNLKQAMLDQAEHQKQQAVEAGKVADRELDEAKEQLVRYQAEYAFRQDKHDRTVKLIERNALQPEVAEETRNQLEAAKAALKVAGIQIQTKEARVLAAKADLNVAESKIRVAKAELKRLAVLINFATVRAQFNGIVTRRWVDPGAMIKDPSAPLVTIMRTDRVRVVLDVPERDVPLVNATQQNPNGNGKGDKVVIWIPALRDKVPGGEFTGYITRMASALDPSTRTMRAEIELANPDGHLRPGMTGQATIFLDERSRVLTVPSTALVRRGDIVEVYYVANLHGNPPQGIVRRARVELGLDDGRRVEIRSGLTDKELVIAKGNGVIHTGDSVIAVVRPDRTLGQASE